MNKKLIIITAVLAAAMMFSACGKGKKDDGQTEQTQTQAQTDENAKNDAENKDASKDENKENTENKSAQNDNGTSGGNDAAADDNGVGMTADEFENLVDTFNNTQDEAEKEQTRKKIQAILEKAEQQ